MVGSSQCLCITFSHIKVGSGFYPSQWHWWGFTKGLQGTDSFNSLSPSSLTFGWDLGTSLVSSRLPSDLTAGMTSEPWSNALQPSDEQPSLLLRGWELFTKLLHPRQY